MKDRVVEWRLIRDARVWRALGGWLLALAGALAAMAVIESYLFSIPVLFADDWPLTQTITEQGFLKAVLAGHNGIPCYIQNMLWWMDYRWFGYRLLLPHLAENIFWLAGALLLWRIFRAIGYGRPSAMVLAAVFVLLWHSWPNRAQFLHYRFRGVEAAGVFMLLTASLLLLVRYRQRARSTRPVGARASLAAALGVAWTAIFMQGGFAVLPVVSVALLISRPPARRALAIAVVLILYVLFFRQVHYQPPALGESHPSSAADYFIGFAVFIGQVPYALAAPVVGSRAALGLALAICAAIIVCMGALAWKSLRRQIDDRETVALVLFGFVCLVAVGAVWVRISEHGWTYALSDRYSNYSIYAIVGLSLVLLKPAPSRDLRQLGAAAWVGAAAIAACAGTIHTLYEAPRLRPFLEIFMIPYTFEPPRLAPGPLTNERRATAAYSIRPDLKSSGRSVFGSRAYALFEQTRREPMDKWGQLDANIRVDVFQRHVLGDSNRLLGLTANWRTNVPDAPCALVFVDDARRAVGWAVWEARAPWFARLVRPDLRHPARAWGYICLPPAATSVAPVLLDASGRPLAHGRRSTL